MSEAAARSAAQFLRTAGPRLPHSEAVADCLHCNVQFLAEWALELLGRPEPPANQVPGPPDPPKRPTALRPWTEHEKGPQ